MAKKQPAPGVSELPGAESTGVNAEALKGIPKSTEDTLAAKDSGLETVSATPNQGCVCEGQPVVDGPSEGVGNWEGDCKNIKFVTGESMPGDRDAMFTRGGAGRIPYPTASPRDWNQSDVDAPNTKEK